jgi:hypothetical protein
MGFDRFALVAVGVALAACGDDSGSGQVDAASDDGNSDGGDIGTGIPCQYTEMQDATNSTVPMAENSNLTLGSERLAICGKFDSGHFDAANSLVDADGIIFNVAAQTDVIVHLIGPQFASAPADQMVVQILKQGVNQLFGFGIVEGNHGSLVFRLPAGAYVAAVYAVDTAAISAPIDYQILISADTPRCAAKTSAADHTEGADNGANDVIDYFFVSNQQSNLTPSTTDAAETTNITVAAGTSYLIDAGMADVNPTTPDDDYEDSDTFLFTTGPSTTQMSVRLNWTSTTADLDYRVYPVPTGDPESIVGGLDNRDMEDEYETFAVKPNTQYWLWVAAEDGATPATPYKATLCGETFTP